MFQYHIFGKYENFDNYSSDYLGKALIACMNNCVITEAQLEIMKQQVPRKIKEMKPEYALDIFEKFLDLEIVTKPLDYLVEYHFFMHIWKQIGTYNLDQILKSVELLERIEFTAFDSEFYENTLFPEMISKA